MVLCPSHDDGVGAKECSKLARKSVAGVDAKLVWQTNNDPVEMNEYLTVARRLEKTGCVFSSTTAK
jgi:hypothetical protein